MKQAELIWASDNPDWEDVRCPADRLQHDGEQLHVHYSGATDEGGRYEGRFTLALRSGMQSLEGEYTVYPPKGSAEPFTQVVGFALTGSLKPLPDGEQGFTGIWEESGVAQAFTVGPLPQAGEGDVAVTEAAFRFETMDNMALPAAWRAHAAALQTLEQALWTYRHLVEGSVVLAGVGSLLDQIDAVQADAKGRFDAQLAMEIDEAALLDYLRDEASLALERLLDEGAGARLDAAAREQAPDLAAEWDALAARISTGIQAEGYEVCRVWLGLTDASA